ncbi:MAG: SBBP repeat-containing protein [Ignavibacteriaceae bacterium]|nr:SBBP repeat-containing protein [Ignavibacteriaceae bacterium]
MKHIGTKNNLLLFLLLFVTSQIHAQDPDFSLNKNYGGIYKEYGNAITTDNAGNIYMTGETFSPSVNFGNGIVLSAPGLTGTGNCEFFLTKFDKLGNAIWSKKGGGSLTDRGYGVVIDNTGNLVVAGHYFGMATFDTVTRTSAGNLDAFIAKYDTSGNILWFREGRDVSQSSVRGLAYDNNGNTVITGYYGSSTAPTVTFDNIVLTTKGERDIYIVKYNSDGVIQWGVSAGGVKTGEEGKAVVCDANGNIYVTGMFADTASFGNITLIGNGSNDIFVAKYNAQGQIQWAKSAGGPKADVGYAIDVDINGNLYVGGSFDSLATFGSTLVYANGDTLTDAFVALFDTDGNFKWVKTFGGENSDNCSKLLTDTEGNCYAFGNFRSTALAGAKFGNLSLNATSVGYDDVYFMKLSLTGELLWVKQAGGDDLDRITDATINSNGKIFAVGYYKNYLKIGTDSLKSGGNEDIFLSQIGDNVVPVELASFSANFQKGKILLRWSTATETNNYGFEIERSRDKIAFVKIGFIRGNGTATEKNDYSYSDNNLNSEKYYYRLKQIDLDGSFTYSNIIEVKTEFPEKFELLQNYPNPFNPETNISFTLPMNSKVTLSVYNVLGELVESLINKELNAGKHSVVFDASKYVSGVFFYKLNSFQDNGNNHFNVKKMIVTK